jgi:hypothetical protein
MRSQDRKVITIIRDPSVTTMPGFVALGQRHLEKTRPAPTRHLGSHLVSFLIPVDLVSMVLPNAVTKDYESVEFIYKAKKS